MPEMTKLSDCSALLSTRRRGIFFCCSNTASSVAPVSMRKVSICNWPCSELQRVPLTPGVTLVASRPGRPRRAPVTGSSISRQPTSLLPRLDGRGKRRALLRAHHAGHRILVPRLVGLHGRDQPVAEFAVDRPGEVAAPGEVVLDRHALGQRDRGVGVLQSRRLRGGRAVSGAAGGGALAAPLPLDFGFRRGLGLRSRRRASALPRRASAWRLRSWRRRFGSWLWPWRRILPPAWRRARDWPSESPCASAAEVPKITAKIAANTRIRTPKRRLPHPSRNRGDAPMMGPPGGSMLTPEELERYARHIVLREVGGPGQQALGRARVLVIGAGGLGRAGAALSRRGRRRHAGRDRRRHRGAVEPAAPGDPRHAGRRPCRRSRARPPRSRGSIRTSRSARTPSG